MSERGFHHWPPSGARERRRLVQLSDGGLFLTVLLVNKAEVEIRRDKVRVQLDGLEELFGGPVILARVEVMPTEMRVERQVDWIECERAQTCGEGFFNLTPGHPVMRVIVMYGAIVRFEIDGALEFAFRLGPVPIIIQFGVPQRGVRFAERVVNR